jgi:ABC-type uncharacterized transport system auxiliary subunit
MRVRNATLLLACGLAAGCFGLSQPSPDIREYRLDYTPPAVTGRALPVTLRVPPLAVAAIYDRQPIVYRDDAYATGTYFYSRWSTNPGAMLADLLARDLAASGLYAAIQQGPSLLASDYQLSGGIEEIEERMSAASCTASLRLRVLLVRIRGSSAPPVLLQTTYAEQEPCRCNDVRDLARAMSSVLQRISAQLQQAVYEAIEKDRST